MKGIFIISLLFFLFNNITSLDLINFNTKNVFDISGLFQSCISLTSLSLTNFDTSNVSDMSETFKNCRNLKMKLKKNICIMLFFHIIQMDY